MIKLANYSLVATFTNVFSERHKRFLVPVIFSETWGGAIGKEQPIE